MNYKSFGNYLYEEQQKYKLDENKTAYSNFGHYRTILKSLVEIYKLVDPEKLRQHFTFDFEDLMSNFKTTLVERGKSERSPLSRLRAMQKIYLEITNIDYTNKTISEVLIDAAKRKYGDMLYTDHVSIGEFNKVLRHQNSMSIKQLCNKMVEEGIKKDPSLWPKTDPDNIEEIKDAARSVRDYFVGKSVPSLRVPLERIYFIEEYLMIDKGVIVNKTVRGNKKVTTPPTKTKKRTESEKKAYLDKQMSVKVLNTHLTNYFNEYRSYKIGHSEPTVRNISKEMKSMPFAELRTTVKEKNKSRDGKWTIRADGEYSSAESFKLLLLFFMNYCIEQENIAFDDVSTDHLTQYALIKRLCYAGKNGRSPSYVTTLLSYIGLGCQRRGYLRLCGDRGNRDINDYFSELDFIGEEIDSLYDIVKGGTKKINTNSGKQNIMFLMNIEKNKRVQLCFDASNKMLDESDYLISESKKKTKPAWDKVEKSTTHKIKELKSTAHYIEDAFSRVISAFLLKYCFTLCPRSNTWSYLRYCPTIAESSPDVPSIVFHSHKDTYEINIPRYTRSLDNPENIARVFKNSNSISTKNINMFLKTEVVPIMHKLIKIRSLYIENHISFYVKKCLDEADDVTRTIKEMKIDDEAKSIFLREHNLDIEAFENYSPEKIDMLFPYFSRVTRLKLLPHLATRESYITSRRRRRFFIRHSTKLGEDFEKITHGVFSYLMPNEKQRGINIHALRHLSAMTFLQYYPGQDAGAAAILNDSIEMIRRTYGTTDNEEEMKTLNEKTTYL